MTMVMVVLLCAGHVVLHILDTFVIGVFSRFPCFHSKVRVHTRAHVHTSFTRVCMPPTAFLLLLHLGAAGAIKTDGK